VENSEKIIQWTLYNSSYLKLRVEYYSEVKVYSSSLFDIGLYITINQKEYFGRGTDSNEEIAYCKAFSEAVERSSLAIFNIKNTNGLAAHPILEEAQKNARNEVLERDAFFCAFLLKRGFKPYRSNLIKRCIYFIDQKIEINFYEMCRYKNEVGILCVASGKDYIVPFGSISGSAFGASESLVAEKALLEVVRVLTNICFTKEVKSLTITDFEKIEDVGFRDHGKLALDIEYAKKMHEILNYPYLDIRNAWESHFSYESFDMKKFPLPDIPLFVVQATNNQLQNVFVGQTKEMQLNLVRLKEVSGNMDSLFEINLLPHPFD
jgi:hypothetical protein